MSALGRIGVAVAFAMASVTAPVLAGPANAAPGPVISAVGPAAGPLKPTVIQIRGKRLKRVTAVRFGTRNARILRKSNTVLRVRTPKGVRPGRVNVQVRTKAGWSRRTKKARYTFVGRPGVTGVSTAQAPFAGGDRITLRGTNLKTVRQVTIAGVRARIASKAARRIVVTTPPGVPGRAPIQAISVGGKSKLFRGFSYVTPRRDAPAQLTPAPGTTIVEDVQWVTGGDTDPETGVTSPYVVSLAPGVAAPARDAGYVVRPGAAAFPSGLAGKVIDVASQIDESTRVTVTPVAASEVLTEGHISYAGPVVTAGTSAEVESGSSYSISGPSALFCRSDDGNSVEFSSSLALAVTDQDVDTSLDWGGVFSRPKVFAAYTNELAVTGKVTVAGKTTCELKADWANARRRVVPLGASGATLSFGPSFEVEFSGAGTYSVEEVVRNTFSVESELGRTPSVARASRVVRSEHGGAGSYSAELTGGASVQVGYFDRAGIEGKAVLGADASLTATGRDVCVDAAMFGRIGLGVFLDAVVARWDHTIGEVTLPIGEFERCLVAEPPEQHTEPEIISSRLPSAQQGQAYEAYLQTADHRAGTWTVVSGALPAGLTLDGASGAITGSPTANVGDYSALVDFTDEADRTATAMIWIEVLPSEGLGGGDLQVTLRWDGPADLDLHMEDPSGEHIYFGNRDADSGGELDHDANAACNGPDDDNPVENITWPAGLAPAGNYIAWVDVWAECDGPLGWQLTVRKGGVVVDTYTGTGNSDAFGITMGGANAGQIVRKALPKRLADLPRASKD